MSVTVERLNEIPQKNPYLPVKITEMGNIIELLYMNRKNNRATIRMLPGGDCYLEISTGEIKDIVHHNTRAEQKNSMYRTFRTLRGVINTNCSDVSRVRWITLTYAENMTDTKQLYKDFERFNKRFQYYCKTHDYGKPEYIVICEPQGRGAWHCHLLYIFPDKAPFIPNHELAEIWGHGFVVIKKLDNVDNVGAYLTAYLGDMELNELMVDGKFIDVVAYNGSTKLGSMKTIETVDNQGNKVSKRYIKGARLAFYPANFNIYRCSRGVIRPVEEYISQDEAKEKVSSGKLTYERILKITDIANDFESFIHEQYYNMASNRLQHGVLEEE